MFVQLSSRSSFPVNGNVTVLPGRLYSQYLHSSSVSGTHAVRLNPAGVPYPALQIVGPTVISPCSPSNLALQLVFTGSGGRALSMTWRSSLGETSSGTSFPVSYSGVNQTVVYNVTGTNWLGSVRLISLLSLTTSSLKGLILENPCKTKTRSQMCLNNSA